MDPAAYIDIVKIWNKNTSAEILDCSWVEIWTTEKISICLTSFWLEIFFEIYGKISILSSLLCVGFLWPKLSPANDGRALKLSVRGWSSVTAALGDNLWPRDFFVTPPVQESDILLSTRVR